MLMKMVHECKDVSKRGEHNIYFIEKCLSYNIYLATLRWWPSILCVQTGFKFNSLNSLDLGIL